MKPTAEASACQTNNDGFHTMNPQDSSRYIACVSAAAAVVWGSFFAVFAGSPPDGFLTLVLWVTVHHIGQAVTSAISFKAGGAFAFFALAALSVDFLSILFSSINNLENVTSLAGLISPAVCSGCALIIFRRHSEPYQVESL